VIRAAILALLVLACASGASAGAPVGALTQLVGTFGCVQPKAADGCAVARASRSSVIAISPDGGTVYAAGGVGSASHLSVFRRNPGTGALTQLAGARGCFLLFGARGCARWRHLESPQAILVSPDGRNVYVVAENSRAIDVFRRRADGSLVQLTGRAGCLSRRGSGGDCARTRGLGRPVDAAISPDGRSVYVAAESLVVLARDPGTGVLTQLDGAAGCVGGPRSAGCAVPPGGNAHPEALAVTPDGAFLVMVWPEGEVVFRRDGATGALTFAFGSGCTDAPGEGSPSCPPILPATVGTVDVATSTDGARVYRANGGHLAGINARELDPAAGTLGVVSSCLGAVPAATCATARNVRGTTTVVVSPDGASVYLGGSAGLAIFTRDPATGALAQLAGRAGCLHRGPPGPRCAGMRGNDAATGVAVSPDGRHVYLAGGGIAAFRRAR
jgi:DNA-binding beta-propeller fold protein YncE